MRQLMTFWLSASLLLTGLLPAQAQDTTQTGTIYQTVNVRSGPDTQFAIVTKLEAGNEVTVNGRESEATRWLRIVLDDVEGVSFGWITSFSVALDADPSLLPIVGLEAAPDPDPASTAEPTPLPPGQVLVVAYGRVNIRSGPDITYDVVGQLEIGDEAFALARSNRRNDWLYIEPSAQVVGWVAFFTVTVVGDPAELPVRVLDGSASELVPPSSLITTRFNVRLRSEPSTLQGAVIGIVSFGSQVTPLAQTEDGRWLYVVFEDFEGWALTQLFAITDEQQTQVPVYDPGQAEGPPGVTLTPALEETAESEITPEATPEATATD